MWRKVRYWPGANSKRAEPLEQPALWEAVRKLRAEATDVANAILRVTERAEVQATGCRLAEGTVIGARVDQAKGADSELGKNMTEVEDTP